MAGSAQVERLAPLGGAANGRVCAGNKRDGSPCNAPASPGARFCFNHDPAKAAERKRNASRAGRSRGPGQRVSDLDQLLARLYEDVLAGVVERGVGAVAAQIIGARIRLIETERRVAEVEKFEERVAELEAIATDKKHRGGRRRW